MPTIKRDPSLPRRYTESTHHPGLWAYHIEWPTERQPTDPRQNLTQDLFLSLIENAYAQAPGTETIMVLQTSDAGRSFFETDKDVPLIIGNCEVTSYRIGQDDNVIVLKFTTEPQGATE